MNSGLQSLIDRLGLTAGRYSAFGAAVGGLFGLMIVNVFGRTEAGVLAWAPGLSVPKVAVAVVVLLQAVGVLIAWAAANNRATRL